MLYHPFHFIIHTEGVLVFHFLSHLTWWSVVWVVVGICTFYTTLTLDLVLNGGQAGGWRPMAYAWELISWWYLPQAAKRRELYMKKHIARRKQGDVYCGVLLSTTRAWRYSEVVANNQYLECANDILPSRCVILVHLLVALLWPVVMLLLVITIITNIRSRRSVVD